MERNRKAGQNPQRVVAPIEEEEVADGKTKDSGQNGSSHFSELNNKLNACVRYVIAFQPLGFWLQTTVRLALERPLATSYLSCDCVSSAHYE